MELRRLTARRALVGEILSGRFIAREQHVSSYVITPLGRRLSRVRVAGMVVNDYSNPEKDYRSFTVDDGTGTIRVKCFGNVPVASRVERGSGVYVFGKLRMSAGEIWINGEIVVPVNDPYLELYHVLEIVKMLREQKEKYLKVVSHMPGTSDVNELFALLGEEVPKKDIEAVLEAREIFSAPERDEKVSKLLELIEELDEGRGAEYKKLLQESGMSEEEFDSTLQYLLEKGFCYEPEPGKIKKVM